MLTCPKCSNAIDSKTEFCPYCDTPVADYVRSATSVGVTTPSSIPVGGNPVVYRYLDLYRAARLLVGIGNTVKVLGIVVGVAILLLCLFAGVAGSTQNSTSQSGFFALGAFVVGAVFGAFVGGIVFLLGILISAQGQILLAQADSAIHTSPFMTDEEKANAMSISFSAPSNKSLDASGGSASRN